MEIIIAIRDTTSSMHINDIDAYSTDITFPQAHAVSAHVRKAYIFCWNSDDRQLLQTLETIFKKTSSLLVYLTVRRRRLALHNRKLTPQAHTRPTTHWTQGRWCCWSSPLTYSSSNKRPARNRPHNSIIARCIRAAPSRKRHCSIYSHSRRQAYKLGKCRYSKH